MGVHVNLLIACTQAAGETGLTGIVIFLTEIEPQHGTRDPTMIFTILYNGKILRSNQAYPDFLMKRHYVYVLCRATALLPLL